jgi:uncharacterized protein YbjT (DUF2867 family)
MSTTTVPSSPRVLVLGATGLVGARLVARLAADGFAVRGLVRHPDRATQLPPGVELLGGEVRDAGTLARALQGCDAVCCCLPWELEAEVVASLVTACAGRRIHLVYLSGLTITPANAGGAMAETKLRAEALLVASGLDCTIFKPSWFLDALPRFVRGGRATLFGRQALPYRLVALDDFAALVSAALRNGGRGARTVVVEGAEAVPLPAALQAYCDAVHPGLQARALPLWVGRALAWLSRDAELRAFVELMAYFEGVREVSPERPTVTGTGLSGWLASLPRTPASQGSGRPMAAGA